MSKTKICEQISEFLYDVLQDRITAVEQAYLNDSMPKKPFITMQITSSESENLSSMLYIDSDDMMRTRIDEVVKVRLRSYADNVLVASELLNTARNYLYTDKVCSYFYDDFIFRRELSSVNAIATEVNESYEYSATLDLEFSVNTYVDQKVNIIKEINIKNEFIDSDIIIKR